MVFVRLHTLENNPVYVNLDSISYFLTDENRLGHTRIATGAGSITVKETVDEVAVATWPRRGATMGEVNAKVP